MVLLHHQCVELLDVLVLHVHHLFQLVDVDFLHVRLGTGTVELDRPVELDTGVNPLTEYQPIPLREARKMVERRTKLQLADQDIYVNIVGGIRITEPAADLAICMAIGSAAKGLQLKQNAVVFGEVGLAVGSAPCSVGLEDQALAAGATVGVGIGDDGGGGDHGRAAAFSGA